MWVKGQNTGTQMMSEGRKLFCMREIVVQDWLMLFTPGHIRERQNGAWTLGLLIYALGLFSALLPRLRATSPGTGHWDFLLCKKMRPTHESDRKSSLALWWSAPNHLSEEYSVGHFSSLALKPWCPQTLRGSENGRNRGFWST